MTNGESTREPAVDHSRSDRARSLASLHSLEQAAGSAGQARFDEWRHDVLAALDELASTLHEQHATSGTDEGLLGQVLADAPQLAPAVTDLRKQQRELEERIDQLRAQLADHSRCPNVADARSELAEITATVRDLRAWETDIVYEAYSVDLGAGD